MSSYVYLITNIFSNKYYIGKTNNKNIRWSQHKSKSKVKNSYLYNSIKKYGIKNFTFEIIKECETENDAFEYERVLIELFNLRNKKYGYNQIEGGSGGSKGYKVKDELKKYFKEKYIGSNSVRSKFSDKDIIDILDKYSSGYFTAQELADQYHCGKSTMIRIINGTAYANIKYDRSTFAALRIKNKTKNVPRGTSVKTSKLSDKEVLKIRELYSTKQYSYQKLGDMFKVTKTNIYYIVNNLSRKR